MSAVRLTSRQIVHTGEQYDVVLAAGTVEREPVVFLDGILLTTADAARIATALIRLAGIAVDQPRPIR